MRYDSTMILGINVKSADVNTINLFPQSSFLHKNNAEVKIKNNAIFVKSLSVLKPYALIANVKTLVSGKKS